MSGRGSRRGPRAGEGASRRTGKEGVFWLDGQISPSFFFFWGLALAPAVVLQDRLWLKGLEAVALAALAGAAGRARFPGSLAGSLVFLAATAGVNLLSPTGRVLVSLGPLSVTEGALAAGLRKGLTVVALAFLSRLCVRDDLGLPGRIGRYLRETFGFLNALLARKGSLRGGELIPRIDRTLEAVWREGRGETAAGAAPARTTAAGYLLMIAAAALMWVPAVCRV